MIPTCYFNTKCSYTLHALWWFQVLCMRFDIQRGIYIWHPQWHIKTFHQQDTASFMNWSLTLTKHCSKGFDFISACLTQFLAGDYHQDKGWGLHVISVSSWQLRTKSRWETVRNCTILCHNWEKQKEILATHFDLDL